MVTDCLTQVTVAFSDNRSVHVALREGCHCKSLTKTLMTGRDTVLKGGTHRHEA
jgi:hypothetical protein